MKEGILRGFVFVVLLASTTFAQTAAQDPEVAKLKAERRASPQLHRGCRRRVRA